MWKANNSIIKHTATNTLAPCSSVDTACYCEACGLFTTWDSFAENACSPLNKGTWLWSITTTFSGWSCKGGSLTVEIKCVLACCQKQKQQEAHRRNPIREEPRSLDWITGHPHNVSSLTVCPRFSGKPSPTQLFRLTRQHATLNRGQESGLEGALLSQLLDAVPLDFLNMFPAVYVFIKENTLVILNWKKQRK